MIWEAQNAYGGLELGWTEGKGVKGRRRGTYDESLCPIMGVEGRDMFAYAMVDA